MSMKPLVLSLLLPAAILTLAACNLGKSVDTPGAAGRWGSQHSGQPWLVLAEEGQFSGSDRCNRLIGQWSHEGAEISMGQVASTRMFCAGVDDWLSKLHRATVVGNTLQIFDAQDQLIGTLKRADT